jgi:hypothetical protein
LANPLQHLAPAEIAPAVLFFAPLSRVITGQTLDVGRTMD